MLSVDEQTVSHRRQSRGTGDSDWCISDWCISETVDQDTDIKWGGVETDRVSDAIELCDRDTGAGV